MNCVTTTKQIHGRSISLVIFIGSEQRLCENGNGDRFNNIQHMHLFTRIESSVNCKQKIDNFEIEFNIFAENLSIE